MLRKAIRRILFFLFAAGLFSSSSLLTNNRAQASMLAMGTGTLFTQDVDPAGELLLSSRLDPDGSNNDKYVWDNFTLQTTEIITEIAWIGGYDPLRFGSGGPVIDFSLSIYPSISAGTEPAVANDPLVQYLAGGNAAQTSIGMVSTVPMYSYAYTLPAPFIAQAGVKYWVQIQAFQQGTIPDWGIAGGTGGNSSHYLRESGVGGDNRYHAAPGDAAFTLNKFDGLLTFFYIPVISR